MTTSRPSLGSDQPARPQYLLYLPGGALLYLKPFLRWVHTQPTVRIEPGLDRCVQGENNDLIEFYPTVDWEYLADAVSRLLAGHCPFVLLLTIPQCPGTRSTAAFARVTPAVRAVYAEVASNAPPGCQYWQGELDGPVKFSLFDELAGCSGANPREGFTSTPLEVGKAL